MKLSNTILNAAVVASALCTMLVTGIVVRREVLARPGALSKPIEIEQAEWKSISTTGLRIGPREPVLTIVEFVDFECPACGAFYRTLRRFQSTHDQEVAVVLQHFPLDMHPNALRLAKSVECAAQRGVLEALQDSIFSRQPFMAQQAPGQLAAIVGIQDTADFVRCVADSVRTRGVAAGLTAAGRLGITATPTVIANGMRYRQLVDSALLSHALETARNRGR